MYHHALIAAAGIRTAIPPLLSHLSLLAQVTTAISSGKMRHLLSVVLPLVAAMSMGIGMAQRPPSASICDYYAMERYGTNSSDAQFKLMEHIVALAFGGGAALSHAAVDIKGILNLASYGGTIINLIPWFDGSKATTNLNDQAVGIDWLDNGGTQPLVDFLNGKTSSVELDPNTNE
ncbi:hypothetical protein F4808DRAFT_365305 [Astrocystis sublimbata]|nr:hypothetical protein F4808DRAFT_365305 [Astrocystis sublimbata]